MHTNISTLEKSMQMNWLEWNSENANSGCIRLVDIEICFYVCIFQMRIRLTYFNDLKSKYVSRYYI